MSNAKRDRSKYLYRKGKYFYFRMPGTKELVSMPPEGTPEFNRAYDDCMKSVGKSAKTGPAPAIKDTERVVFVGSTVGRAVEVYLQSSSFKANKPTTQHRYRISLDHLRSRIGETKLADLDIDAVDIYSDQLAGETGPASADLHVTLLHNIWQACKKFPEFGIKGMPDPTRDAEQRYTKVKQPHKPWNEKAQDLFFDTAPENLKLAKLLLHFSAQRGGDCVKIKWADFDGHGLFVMPEKGNVESEPNYHLCPKPLLEALRKAKPSAKAETILVSKWGKPWSSANALGHSIRAQLIKVGLAKKGTRTISMHGLRKTAASEVGGLLLGARGIKSVTGHKSDQMANYYAQHADQIEINKKVVSAWDKALDKKSKLKLVRGGK